MIPTWIFFTTLILAALIVGMLALLVGFFWGRVTERSVTSKTAPVIDLESFTNAAGRYRDRVGRITASGKPQA